ncbi:polyunsaturated fatty acid lipoxygenase ALOX15B isoform X1 [Tachyglossus aculeatus]|uniref:polyunsaturated fatty acid lipoxygenase ALOX15B isoform X1 n=1 Tax=Tachyglossus aculeatus TaxID=9261 RepID=UPI0018F6B66D|nr:polyunsaturated fatty acid lipoxygenase ALOX15B isoform X1 [Tachyglossus aculeatus]
MAVYGVRIITGGFLGAGTWDHISISLVGSEGKSPPLHLDTCGKDFSRGAEEEFTVCSEPVGSLLFLQLHKAPLWLPTPLPLPLPPDAWFCSSVHLIPPEGPPLNFPCYQWLEGACTLVLREGTAKLASSDTVPLLLEQRRGELQKRQGTYRWKTYAPGWPHCVDVEAVEELSPDVHYSLGKSISFFLKASSAFIKLKMKGLLNDASPWKDLKDLRQIFSIQKTPVYEYVVEHWKEDELFASQFLNGLNPILIQRCRQLPPHFPVTDAMVAPFLGRGTSLDAELKRGTMFLVDYKLLDGIPAGQINGKQQYVAAPLCLLQQPPGRPLRPIAIQLSQTPGPDSPIFLPSDSEWDWLTAKTWVRSAEFAIHEAVSHLGRAHLLPEVFSIATLRQLPLCHPLYKLLIPHTRYTLHINVLARQLLISPGGVVQRSTAVGVSGFTELVRRDLEQLTYSTLCLPEDVRARGVSNLPGYHYRDDGLKIWGAIESYVSEIVGFYYGSDAAVEGDMELQAWVWEIFAEGFLGRETSGVPPSLESRAALIRYLTMVIFTCSAQHAAFSAGQFDFSAWMPNFPPSMQLPPPTAKGLAGPESFLASLPDINATCDIIIVLWLLSKEPGDLRSLGCFPDAHFTEEAPRRSQEAFAARLAEISRQIQERNARLPLPYTYLDPPNIENSVAI